MKHYQLSAAFGDNDEWKTERWLLNQQAMTMCHITINLLSLYRTAINPLALLLVLSFSNRKLLTGLPCRCSRRRWGHIQWLR